VIPFSYTSFVVRLQNYADDLANIVAGEVDLQKLHSAIQNFREAATKVTEEIDQIKQTLDPSALASLNYRLTFTERQFLLPEGLPERPWFRHTLQAPGLTEGYDSVTFPGVTDAIELGNWDEARSQASIVAGKINSAADFLRGGGRPTNSEPLSALTVAMITLTAVLIVSILVSILVYVVWNSRKRQHEEEKRLIDNEEQ